jgi:hypothetical protein
VVSPFPILPCYTRGVNVRLGNEEISQVSQRVEETDTARQCEVEETRELISSLLIPTESVVITMSQKQGSRNQSLVFALLRGPR